MRGTDFVEDVQPDVNEALLQILICPNYLSE